MSRSEVRTLLGRMLYEDNAGAHLRNININLKQWRMLSAVVTCGSYGKAAEFLHISQPAISYTIAKMEEQLGVPLLKLEGRKAQLTESGRALLERARILLQDAADLEELAESIRRGSGPRIRLAVDQNFPTSLLLPVLGKFSIHGRSAKVHLIEVPATEMEKILQSKSADVAINEHVPPGYRGDLLMETENVLVAHPDHALFRLKRELTQADLDREIWVMGMCCISPEQRAAAHAGTSLPDRGGCWQVSNLDTAEQALIEGIGYGWLPRHRIERALKMGQLAILPLRQRGTYTSKFHLILARPFAPTVDAVHLVEVLRSVATGMGAKCGSGIRISAQTNPARSVFENNESPDFLGSAVRGARTALSQAR